MTTKARLPVHTRYGWGLQQSGRYARRIPWAWGPQGKRDGYICKTSSRDMPRGKAVRRQVRGRPRGEFSPPAVAGRAQHAANHLQQPPSHTSHTIKRCTGKAVRRPKAIWRISAGSARRPGPVICAVCGILQPRTASRPWLVGRRRLQPSSWLKLQNIHVE